MYKKSSSFVKSNKFVPLISDVLPYETPIKFSNANIYKTLKEDYEKLAKEYYKNKAQGKTGLNPLKSVKEFFLNDYIPKTIKDTLLKKSEYTIPYNYNIKKNLDDYREMSLIHPISQCSVCDFYNQYKDTIIYNTTKSKYSLRFPAKISKIVHREFANKEIELAKINGGSNSSQTADIEEQIIEDGLLNDDLQDLISTFFIYKKYSHMYKFYLSNEYIDNEKRFQYLTKLDVSKFFNSIYTHSISWAIKNKEYIKSNLNNDKNSFGGSFDNLMQESNYNETNGIPIGSEVSRIFSEIIMQAIDLEIEKKLDTYKSNFKISRYLDDYFVFYNDKSIYNLILETIKKELKKYNLFLNESKTTHYTRPFVTNQTLTKEKLQDLIKEFLDFCSFDNEKIIFKDKKEIATYHWFLKKYRMLLVETQVSYNEVSSFLLKQIQKKLIFVLKKILEQNYEKNIENIEFCLNNIINLIFYINITSQSASTNYTLCKISHLILSIAEKINENILTQSLNDKILQETLISLEIIENKKEKILIEQLDLLLLLKKVQNQNYRLSTKKLENIFRMENDLSYFEIIILLDYIDNEQRYDDLKEKIVEMVKNKLKNSSLLETENFLLFFDLIKSPYLNEKSKKQILSAIGIENNKILLIKEIEQKEWFYYWGEFTLKKLLETKELIYGS